MPPSALVMVDVQNDFVSGSLALRNCPAQQEAMEIVPIVNALRHLGFDMVVLTQDWHPSNHLSFIENAGKLKLAADTSPPVLFQPVRLENGLEQMMWPQHCVQESWGAELVDGLEKLSSDCYIYKGFDPDLDSYSAFWDNVGLVYLPFFIFLLSDPLYFTRCLCCV